MHRIVYQGCRVCNFDKFTKVHDNNPVAQKTRRCKIMRNEQNADSLFTVHFLQQVQNACAQRHIQHGNRLVGNDKFRVDHKRTRNRHALSLPAGELMRIPVLIQFNRCQLHHAQRFGDALLQFVVCFAEFQRLQRLRDNLTDGHFGVQRIVRILENHLQLFPEGNHLLSSADR